MRFFETARAGVTALAALVAAASCSGHVTQGGSETNWLCSDDGDCTAGQRCVEKRCQAAGGASTVVQGPDAGVTDAGAGGSAGSASAAGGGVGGSLSERSTTQFTEVVKTVDCAPGQCLSGICLPLALERDPETGRLPCSVIDASERSTGCDPTTGWLIPSAKIVEPVKAVLEQRGVCGVAGTPACESLRLCELKQAAGADLETCLNGAALPVDSAGGWCYLDAADGPAAATVLGKCSGTEPRVLRLPPLSGNHTLVITCFDGEPLTSSQTPGTGKIGDPFIPQDELRHEFSGFSATEVNIENRSPSCESGIGLVYGFTGRVTCPYGQLPDPNDPSHADPAQQSCLTPSGAPVTVPVNPQSKARRPSDAVYCSCRCEGPDTNAAYCACPTGFECKSLVQDYGFGDSLLSGSFCIKSGTDYTPGTVSSPCDRVTQNCGPP